MLQLALFLFTASAFAQTRDYWLKMERKGTGFGYEHITIRQLKNGNLEYQIRQHQKTGIAGLIQQDIIQQCTYLVNAEFHQLFG